jgi:hypothetical protein
MRLSNDFDPAPRSPEMLVSCAVGASVAGVLDVVLPVWSGEMAVVEPSAFVTVAGGAAGGLKLLAAPALSPPTLFPVERNEFCGMGALAPRLEMLVMSKNPFRVARCARKVKELFPGEGGRR